MSIQPAGKTPDADRRRAPRFRISQMVEVRFDRERWVHAEGLDVSATGVRCRTVEELDPGTSIFLMISIDAERSVLVDAVLIHTRETDDGAFEAGFAFTHFHDSSRAVLDAYLDALDSLDSLDAEN